MRLVIDTNVLISALVADSKTRELIIDSNHKLYSPDYLLSEIRKYEEELIEKSGLREHEFRTLLVLLLNEVSIIPIEEYRRELEKAKEIMEKIDVRDVPFLACALAKNAKIWSDDYHFERQKLVDSLKTQEVLQKR